MTTPNAGGSFAWCFCNSSREHIAEFDTDMRVMRFRLATNALRQQFKAYVLYRWGFIWLDTGA